MTDDIDASYRIVTAKPLKPGACSRCGVFMNGFAKCPWCGGERKVPVRPRRWVGKVELE